MKQDFDVDIVIPWVDGGDKKWQEEKNKYLPAIIGRTMGSKEIISQYRYRKNPVVLLYIY